jgi:hypothetical protein
LEALAPGWLRPQCRKAGGPLAFAPLVRFGIKLASGSAKRCAGSGQRIEAAPKPFRFGGAASGDGSDFAWAFIRESGARF